MASQQTNVVEILIQAKDQASKTIGVLSDLLGTAGVAAQLAQGKIAALGGALEATSVSGVKSLSLLSEAIQSIRSSLDTAVGQNLMRQLSSAADEALNKTAKLSTIVKEVSGASKDFGAGFASISSSNTIQLFDPVVIGKQLENVVTKTAETFSKSLEQKIKNSDLGTALESRLGISLDALASKLDSSLSEVLLSGFVGKNLPSALDTALGSIFGGNLTSKIEQSIQAVGSSNLLGGVVSKPEQDSVGGSPKEIAIATPSLEEAKPADAKPAEPTADAKPADASGKTVGGAIVSKLITDKESFKQIDAQLGGSLSYVIDKLGTVLPQIIDKGNLPIGKLLATKIGDIAQASKKELQAAGNQLVETAFSGFKTLRKNLLGDDLNNIFEAIFDPILEAKKEELKKLFDIDGSGITAAGASIGKAFTAAGASISQAFDQIKKVFEINSSGIIAAGARIGQAFDRIKNLSDNVKGIFSGASNGDNSTSQPDRLSPSQFVSAKREVSGLKQQAITSQRDSTDLSLSPEARDAALKAYQETTEKIKALRTQIINSPIPTPFTKQFAEDIGAISTKVKTFLGALGDTIGSFAAEIKGKVSQKLSQIGELFANIPAQIENVTANIKAVFANINIPALFANLRDGIAKAFANINIPASLANLRDGIAKAFANINIPAALANIKIGFEKFFKDLNVTELLANSKIAIDKFVTQLKTISFPDVDIKGIAKGLQNGFQEISANTKNFIEKSKNSFADFAQSTNLSMGDVYTSLKKGGGEALSSLTQSVGNIGKSLVALGNQNVGDIGKSLASSGLQNVKSIGKSLSSLVTQSVKSIGASLAPLVAEIGPTLLINATISAITTLVDYVNQETKTSTASVDALNGALKEGLVKQDILNKSQGTDAAKAIQTLMSERSKYVDSIKDPKILENDPTLKLYDQQLAKLRELSGLQGKPDNSEKQLREEVKKERDNFGTKFVEGVAGTSDILRNVLSASTFGLSDKLGLGDRAGSLQEKEVQARLQDTSNTIAKSTEFRVDLQSQLPKQAKLKEDLVKLEQQKNIAEATGDKDGSARADIQIENTKKELSVRRENIETVIKQVQALKGNDVARDAELKRLEKLKEAYQDVNIKIQAINLPRIGNAIEQATAKYNVALDALNKSAGDPAMFKAKLGELLEVSKELQDAGTLRADEVSKNFVRIATNVSVDRDLQIKAQQAITEAYQKESQIRISIYDAQISKTQALLATGKISEAEATRSIGRLEERKLEEQLEAAKKIAKDEQEIRDKRAEEQKAQIQREKELAEAQLAAAQGDPSKIKAVREKQAPQIDRAIAETSTSLEEAKKKQKEIEDDRDAGKVSKDEASSQIKFTGDNIDQLTKQLGSLKEQKGALESTLQLNEGTQKQLDEVVQSISDADEELKNLRENRSRIQQSIENGELVSIGRGRARSRYSPERLAQADSELAVKEAEQRERKAKEAQLRSIITPDPEKAKLAQASITGADDKVKKFNETTGAQNKKAQEVAAAKQLDLDSKLAKTRSENLIKDLDIQIKETLAVERIGEAQRLAQSAQLRKSGIILESEIKSKEANERKRSIALELQLEQQKQKEIEKLEKKGVGVSKETKNANLLKVAELTKSLAEAELAAIESLISAVRDRLVLESQKYAVTIEQQNLKLERQKLLFTALEKGLENQTRLSESANKLAQSIVSLRESEFNALNKIYDRQQAAIRAAGGQGNFADLELEEKKLILAEKLAVLKLNALKQQQQFEAESLERDIQKRDLALDRKRVENEIAIAKKKIDIASQDAAIKSAELEVKLRPQSEEAKLKLAQAKLAQEKNFLEFAGLQQEKGFIGDEARVNEIVSKNDRQSLANKQQGETNTAIGDVIGATRDPALQERLQQEQLARLTQNTGAAALTATDISNAVAVANQPINIRGASFKNPTSALLRQVEQGGTFTAAPVPKPDNAPFATSFEELARKYPAQANSFAELNAKYSGKPTEEAKPEQAIVSSFDKLTKQIDEGFSKILVAPDLKVRELTTGLEVEFDRVSKKISDNPVQLKIDDARLKELQELTSKPIAILDEGQLKRAEAVAQAFGSLGQAVVSQQQGNPAGVASGANGNITVNAPISISAQANASFATSMGGDVQKTVNETLNNVLRRVAGVTSGVR